MKVKDLIAILQRCDQNAEVSVWDAYDDRKDFDVRVTVGADIHVGNGVSGIGDRWIDGKGNGGGGPKGQLY